ncbi:6879_t:CDS:2 [Entrophospora sp. SA101]|nr:6879_t:CDS:2 [Entrophospora sp. SA101]
MPGAYKIMVRDKESFAYTIIAEEGIDSELIAASGATKFYFHPTVIGGVIPFKNASVMAFVPLKQHQALTQEKQALNERRKGIMTTEEQHLEEYRKLPVAITTEVESYAGWLMDAEKKAMINGTTSSNQVQEAQKEIARNRNKDQEKTRLEEKLNQTERDKATAERERDSLAEKNKTLQAENQRLREKNEQLDQPPNFEDFGEKPQFETEAKILQTNLPTFTK